MVAEGELDKIWSWQNCLWIGSVIKIRYEYWCDYCNREIVGADVHNHGADYGRYPVPRGIQRIGPGYACNECVKKAQIAASIPSHG